MVLAHERCGAVKAAIQGGALPGNINSLTQAIQPAVNSTSNQAGDPVENACKANARLQANRLKASPVIDQLIQENKLKVVPAYYDLDTGAVEILSMALQL
jgi:carbonic anhydrase